MCCFGCGQTGHTVQKCPRKAADKPTEDPSAAAEADTAAAEGPRQQRQDKRVMLRHKVSMKVLSETVNNSSENLNEEQNVSGDTASNGTEHGEINDAPESYNVKLNEDTVDTDAEQALFKKPKKRKKSLELKPAKNKTGKDTGETDTGHNTDYERDSGASVCSQGCASSANRLVCWLWRR